MEKALIRNKTVILLRSVRCALIVFSLLTMVCVPIVAHAWSFFNYVDFDYEVQIGSDYNTVYVTVPKEYWRYTVIEKETELKFNFTNTQSFSFYAFAGNTYDILILPVDNYGLDLSNIPVGSKIRMSADISVDNYDTVNMPVPMGRWYYIDSSGKSTEFGWQEMDSAVISSGKYDFIYTVESVSGAKGFVPNYLLHNFYPLTDTDISVTVAMSDVQLEMSISSLYWQQKQNEQQSELLGAIEDKLAAQGKQIDTLTGTVEELPDKIGDEFQGVLDSEKEQSKEEGNKFVDQVLDKLPDPSQGVLAALSELTAAVGYTGTEAIIPFPAIVIPGIDGLFEDIVIYDGSDFDLGSCVSYIPENILTVIQSLFTIAIVLYCVYELKGIISFIFTLKEKNNG